MTGDPGYVSELTPQRYQKKLIIPIAAALLETQKVGKLGGIRCNRERILLIAADGDAVH